MTPESQIEYLNAEITKKEAEMAGKQSQVEMLKAGIDTDKSILKILKKGLESMQSKANGNKANP